MAQIIDGNRIARSIRSQIRRQAKQLGLTPGLAVVQIGSDPSSTIYVNHKEKDCHRVNFYSEVHRLPADINQNDVLDLIAGLNQSDKIDGIITQMPTPEHIDGQTVINAIKPGKDVDALGTISQGNLLIGRHQIAPCTPTGIIRLIDEIGVKVEGKRAVCLGRSTLVGKPIGLLLMERQATITYCHSRTVDLIAETSQADILVVAAGRPQMITAEMIKPGAVVIDVGINRVGTELVGDVDFEAVSAVAGAITPVPGGVGPMTRAILLENTLKLAVENRSPAS
ncbi:MAG: bifunctional 5,10-methylenetetrahydrofolate dehydrogenase/5,10-methenyltetrahydrofolate cyclohydrolase [Candidatus Poribacteria bacterium]|nr:bifunctional 5,10-methylenetetrahydrofolate dehydrogenase/5,10-methenyltetrahydrofolate cyclohydrolase [Candidatus Poribacteria bacterium]